MKRSAPGSSSASTPSEWAAAATQLIPPEEQADCEEEELATAHAISLQVEHVVPRETTSMPQTSKAAVVATSVALPSRSNTEANETASTILLLRGWSPGPLAYLKSHILEKLSTAEHHLEIVEPSYPMPPFGLWWLDVNVIGLLLCFVLFVSSTIYHQSPFTEPAKLRIYHAMVVIISLVWIRILAAIIVRSSVEKGCQIVLSTMRRQARAKKPVSVIVGFSWGGAILAELIAQSQVGSMPRQQYLPPIHDEDDEDTDEEATIKATKPAAAASKNAIQHPPEQLDQPAAMLIAPTTALVSNLAYRADTPNRINLLMPFASLATQRRRRRIHSNKCRPHYRNNIHNCDRCRCCSNVSSSASFSLSSSLSSTSATAMVTVVHAAHDRCFCPHPDRWDQPGVDYCQMNDNHGFIKNENRAALARIFSQLLRRKKAGRNILATEVGATKAVESPPMSP